MHPLEKKIAEKTRELEAASERVRAAHREVAILQAEIAAYSDALAYIPNSNASKIKQKTKTQRVSPINDAWKKIFRELIAWSNIEFGYAELFDAAKDVKVDVNEGSARTVIMDAVNAGILIRIKNGRFKFTDDALKMFGLPSEKGSEMSFTEPPKDKKPSDDLDDIF